MTTEPGYYDGMTPEDEARARAYNAEQLAIQRKREAAARALLAPPGPAAEVKRAWAPVKAAQAARKAGGGPGGPNQ